MIKFFQIFSLFFLFSISVNAQFVNFEDTWQEFLSKEKVAGISKMTMPNRADKHDYAKYCLMYATTDFCGGNIRGAEHYMAEIGKIGEPVYKIIPGFKAKHDDLDVKIAAAQKVNYMWTNFVEHYNVSLEDLEKASDAKRVCEKGTLAKYFHMKAYASYCEGDMAGTKDNFQNRVLKLTEKTSLKAEDVPGLKHEVAQMKGLFRGLEALAPAWKKFMATGKSDGFSKEVPYFHCNPDPNIKVLILNAATDICNSGEKALKQIKKLQNDGVAESSKEVKTKIAWLEKEVNGNEGRVKALDEAWDDYMANGSTNKKYGDQYCDREDELRAWALTGLLNLCEQGNPMLEKVIATQKEEQLNVSEKTVQNIKVLATKVGGQNETVATLDEAWTEFIENGDSLLYAYELLDNYCDKVNIVKSWTLQGFEDACYDGDKFMEKIDDFVKAESLELDEELACRVERLRIAVWDCRYWELVEQARQETHAERESFGPQSAEIMRGDLNSDEQPCETTVEYHPLGYIGIKYIIKTFLCQNIDLAKMGDPEYYKKIATWVDTQVLQQYCEEGLRCKEEFFIYLEGHTDGNAFRGARYKNSLDIPEGTPFTHFDDGEVTETVTDREITTSLKSNMELGIARAWTVKNQLDFMEVPITIGAYEHPSSEKGGEYRRIEIELNITNLMLDFYEKRLSELLEASGIGERPEECE